MDISCVPPECKLMPDSILPGAVVGWGLLALLVIFIPFFIYVIYLIATDRRLNKARPLK
jgi:hypothetical protein